MKNIFLAKVKAWGNSRTLDFYSDTALSHFLRTKCNIGDTVQITINLRKPTRTGQQNAALHLYFSLIADALNEAGYSVQKVLSKKMDMEWDGDSVKELLWRSAQKAILKKESTTELKKTGDIDLILDHLTRHLGEKFEIYVPFPSHEVGYWDSAPLISNNK